MFGSTFKIIGILSVSLMAFGCATSLNTVGAIAPISLRTSPTPVIVSALPPEASAIPDSQITAEVPAGFISFCMRFPDQCSQSENEPSTVALSSAAWQTLEQVNQSINHAIKPMDDEEHYGRAEYWNIPTDGYGDCEDYALTKRQQLIGAGFPEPALRIAVVLTRTQERHAVLTVATDRGDYVLDNLSREIASWDQTGYQWIERQDPKRPWGWVALGRSADPTYVASIADSPTGAAH